MGILEKEAKIRLRRAKIQQALVLVLYGTVGLSVAMFAPNAVKLLGEVDPDLKKKRNPSYRIQQALRRLESRGLVEQEGTRCVLTEKGKKFGERLHTARALQVQKPKRWDRKWRIVIFDVWENRKSVRERLRHLLLKTGFLRVQDSVWIYPYECEELIAFIRTDLKLGSGILYIIAEDIEQGILFQKHFGLTK